MNSLITVIANPVKAFCGLKNEGRFPTVTFIALLALTLINLILTVPINTKVGMAPLSDMEGIPETQIDVTIRLIFEFIMFVVGLLINIIGLFAIARIANMNLEFDKIMKLLLTCFVVIAIGNLANTVLLYICKIEAFYSPFDIQKIAMDAIPSIGNKNTNYTILSYFNPFLIWFVVLVIWGLKVVSEQSLAKSFTVGIIYWLLVVIGPIIVARIIPKCTIISSISAAIIPFIIALCIKRRNINISNAVEKDKNIKL